MKVVIENVRLSFPELSKPSQYEGTGDLKYRAAFMIERGSPNHKKLEAAIKAVAVEKWGKDADKVLGKISRNSAKEICLFDGDKSDREEYEGFDILSASRGADAGRPEVRGADTSPVNQGDEGFPYAGCYVRAIVDIWAQDNKWGKTARATLMGVQFQRDGDAFSGAPKASDTDFEDLSDQGGDETLA